VPYDSVRKGEEEKRLWVPTGRKKGKNELTRF
jgi:hypothetical protein